MFLLNPKNYQRNYPDEKSWQIMLKTIDFFENKGKAKIKEDDQKNFIYLEEVRSYLKNISMSLPEDKRIIISEIDSKLLEMGNRFQ